MSNSNTGLSRLGRLGLTTRTHVDHKRGASGRSSRSTIALSRANIHAPPAPVLLLYKVMSSDSICEAPKSGMYTT